jgi:leucyl aminopeptidase
MKYSSRTGRLDQQTTDCLVVSHAAALEYAKRARLTDYVRAALGDFEDKPGKAQLVALPRTTPAKRLLVAGSASNSSSADFRKSINAVAALLKGARIRDAVISLDAFAARDYDGYQKVRVALALLSSALYRFAAPKRSENGEPVTIARISVLTDGRAAAPTARAIRHAQALDNGLALARDLGNLPPNVCNPTHLAREARKLARADRTRCRVLEERDIEALGMGAFMSVTRGSDTPGKLIVLEYRGGKPKDAPIVLIGKGITFDTGGISLKPGAAMDEMKFDMCGAASVLGCLRAVIDARLPLNVVVMLAAAENMPSGKASRPGDVVRSMSGQTIEILNTDAEGRLVLCDALTYAERFRPKAVVDVATLTGACVVALGAPASGLFANDDALAGALADAGEFVWDRAWRMPLWEDYQTALKSNFADMANVGGRDGGAITAACFLSKFATKFPWAHLDIAGSAYASGAAKGATGRPLPLLFQYVLNQT